MPIQDTAQAYLEPRREVDSDETACPALVEEFHPWHLRLYDSLDAVETPVLYALRHEAEVFVRRLDDELAAREAERPASDRA